MHANERGLHSNRFFRDNVLYFLFSSSFRLWIPVFFHVLECSLVSSRCAACNSSAGAAMHSTAHLRILPVAFVPSPKSLQVNCYLPSTSFPGTAPCVVQHLLTKVSVAFPKCKNCHIPPLRYGSWRLLACSNVRGCAQALLNYRHSGLFAASLLTRLPFARFRFRVARFFQGQETSIAAAKARNQQAERRDSSLYCTFPYLCRRTC